MFSLPYTHAGGLPRLRESRLRVAELGAAVDPDGCGGLAGDGGGGAAVAVGQRQPGHGQHEGLLVRDHQRTGDWQADGPLCGKRIKEKEEGSDFTATECRMRKTIERRSK